LAHVLNPAGHHDICIPNHNCLGCQKYGFQSGRTNLIDRESWNFLGETSLNCHLSRGVLTQSRLEHVAEDNLVHLCGVKL
jgi:hypothetical protein